jgi:PucR family transcriptional regulator, purine catabolism regulatory protein
MRLSVSEAMSSGRLGGAELVAGATGVHNVVSSLVVLAGWDLPDSLESGALVVLDVAAYQTSPSHITGLADKLARLGAAALVVCDDLLVDEAKKIADLKGLPLLAVQDRERWQQFVIGAQRDLLLTQIEIYERVQEIHNALTRAMIDGHGLEEIAQVLANLIHNPVVIESHRFEVLAWHNNDSEPDQVRQRVLEERRVPHQVLEALAHHGVLQRISTEKKPFRVAPIEQLHMQARVMAPILVGNIRYGHISISESNHPLGELDLIAIEQAATLIALQFSLQDVIRERKQRLEESLVYDILFGADATKPSIYQRGNFLGLAFAPQYAVVVIDADDFSSFIKQQQWSETAIQDAKDVLKSQIRGSLLSKGNSALIASGSDALIVLYPLDEGESPESIKGYAQRLQKQMLDVSPNLTFSIGIGRACEDFAELPKSYQDAQSAVAVGRSVRGNGSIMVYVELGIYSLLTKYEDTTLLQDYVEKTLGPLLNYDVKHETELVNTLRTYFRNGGNKNQTAMDMFVHINTIKYRLRKISELVGIDLNNPDDMLNLHLAIKIVDMRHMQFNRG